MMVSNEVFVSTNLSLFVSNQSTLSTQRLQNVYLVDGKDMICTAVRSAPVGQGGGGAACT